MVSYGQLMMVVLKNTGVKRRVRARPIATPYLGVGGVLGDSLGALGDGVLGELTREDQADGRLDLARREGALLVVADELASLNGNALEGVVDERVHDRHGLGGDARVGVHLLEHLVDVRGVRLSALLLLLLVAGSLRLLLGLLGGRLLGRRHVCVKVS